MVGAVKPEPSPRQGKGDRPRRWMRMHYTINDNLINQNLKPKQTIKKINFQKGKKEKYGFYRLY
jgi:hypothetical protein